MARELTAYGYRATLLTVGTSAMLLVDPQVDIPGVISENLKYFGGGSLEIVGATYGSTVAPTFTTSGYLMDGGEAISNDGPARYFLKATGATAQAYLLIGLSQGT